MAEQSPAVLARGVPLALVISVCWLYVNVDAHKVFEHAVSCFGKVAPSRVGQRGEHLVLVPCRSYVGLLVSLISLAVWACFNECYGGVNVRGVLLGTFLFQFLALSRRVLDGYMGRL